MSKRLPPGVSLGDLPDYDNPKQEEIERRAENLMEEEDIDDFEKACEIAEEELEKECEY